MLSELCLFVFLAVVVGKTFHCAQTLGVRYASGHNHKHMVLLSEPGRYAALGSYSAGLRILRFGWEITSSAPLFAEVEL